jgi:hypothetical protein
MWSQLLQPLFVVLVQAALVVVDENARGDVREYSTLHGIYKGERPLYHIPLSYP